MALIGHCWANEEAEERREGSIMGYCTDSHAIGSDYKWLHM